MNHMYLTVTADAEGRLTLPAFAARGMDCAPGETVRVAILTDGVQDGDGSKCAMARVREDGTGVAAGYYTTQGDTINIPAKRMDDAGIPAGSEISVLSSEGVMIIAITDDEHQRDLTDELSCFLEELGCDPERVETARAAQPF